MTVIASLLMCAAGALWLGRKSFDPGNDACCTRLLICIVLNAAALCIWAAITDTPQAFLIWLAHGLGIGMLVLTVNIIASLKTHNARPLQPVAGYMIVMLLIALCGPAANAFS